MADDEVNRPSLRCTYEGLKIYWWDAAENKVSVVPTRGHKSNIAPSEGLRRTYEGLKNHCVLPGWRIRCTYKG